MRYLIVCFLFLCACSAASTKQAPQEPQVVLANYVTGRPLVVFADAEFLYAGCQMHNKSNLEIELLDVAYLYGYFNVQTETFLSKYISTQCRWGCKNILPGESANLNGPMIPLDQAGKLTHMWCGADVKEIKPEPKK